MQAQLILNEQPQEKGLSLAFVGAMEKKPLASMIDTNLQTALKLYVNCEPIKDKDPNDRKALILEIINAAFSFSGQKSGADDETMELWVECINDAMETSNLGYLSANEWRFAIRSALAGKYTKEGSGFVHVSASNLCIWVRAYMREERSEVAKAERSAKNQAARFLEANRPPEPVSFSAIKALLEATPENGPYARLWPSPFMGIQEANPRAKALAERIDRPFGTYINSFYILAYDELIELGILAKAPPKLHNAWVLEASEIAREMGINTKLTPTTYAVPNPNAVLDGEPAMIRLSVSNDGAPVSLSHALNQTIARPDPKIDICKAVWAYYSLWVMGVENVQKALLV
jgi:hypothetical protein